MSQYNDYYQITTEALMGNSQADLNTNKNIEQTNTPSEPEPLNVNITHIPTDWFSISATFGAAFFGALAAFILNGIYEIKKEHERRRTAVNSAMNSFIITLTSLIDIKKQFLTEFDKEFDILREHAAQYRTTGERIELKQEFYNTIVPMLNAIAKKDERFNGAFIKWDEHEFIEITAPESLGFFSDYSPDDIRIFTLAREQVLGTARIIKLRNKTWENHKEHLGLKCSSESMYFTFELLDLRKNLQEFVNFGLTLLNESIQRIEIYNKRHYPERFILFRRLFPKIGQSLFPKKLTVRGHFQKEALALIPNRKEYINIIEPPLN